MDHNLVNSVKDELFKAATSTQGDDESAKEAVKVIVNSVLPRYNIEFYDNPAEASGRFKRLNELIDKGALSAEKLAVMKHCVKVRPRSTRGSLVVSRDSLWNSLWYSLWNSLRDSLRYSLRNSLRNSLWDSLWDSLRDSLWNSLWDSLWYSGDLGILLYAVRSGKVGATAKQIARVEAFAKFAKAASAMWVLPGHVIILRKPKSVEVSNGRLVDIRW